MAVVFRWRGVTAPNTGKKRLTARPDPFWPSTWSIGLDGTATHSHLRWAGRTPLP